MARVRVKYYIAALVLVSFFCGIILGIILIKKTDLNSTWREHEGDSARVLPKLEKNNGISKMGLISAGNMNYEREKPDAQNVIKTTEKLVADGVSVSYDVHTFYYPWYGNPATDGSYLHWNHIYLPHWDKKENARWPSGRHTPPEDIGATFYPKLGPYSSRDNDVMHNHMQQIRSAGIGVLAVSWYPPSQADGQGHSWDDFMLPLMDIAQKYKLKVCFHIEPYADRNQISLKNNLTFIIDKYGQHPAFYRKLYNGKMLPLYYIYDSYLVNKNAWSDIFHQDGAMSVRGTKIDGIFIGLIVERQHQMDLVSAGFDGMYSYFASNGFSYGSTYSNWHSLAKYAKEMNVFFIPSVSPGYNDERVRPWNHKNSKDRERGHYYENSFRAGLNTRTELLSITSFNEWHEGTQIEEAISKQMIDFKYLDYEPDGADFYLSLTRKWVFKFLQLSRH